MSFTDTSFSQSRRSLHLRLRAAYAKRTRRPGTQKFATHCAWSEAFDRIISGLLSEFTRKSKEIASLKADGQILIFDWRCTCGSLHQYPIPGRNTITILLKRHVQNACSLRRFAYVRQQDKPGYVCDCGKELEGEVNAAGKPLRLPEHKKSKVHRSFLDCKNSECDECGLFIDNSIGKEKHLASRYRAFLKELSDDDRRQFLVSSPEIGEIIRVRHVSRGPQEKTIECPDCKEHFAKNSDLRNHRVSRHQGAICLFPGCQYTAEDEKKLKVHLYGLVDDTRANADGQLPCPWPGCKGGKLRDEKSVNACMRHHQGTARLKSLERPAKTQ